MQTMTDYSVFELGDVALQSGAVLRQAKLAYKTYGTPNATRTNVVLVPTFYTGDHTRNEPYFGADRALDPARHFIVVPNLFGNGLSSSPSNAAQAGADFPAVSFYDNVHCQQRLLEEVFGIQRLALVMGWSMGGCQAFQWAAQFPDRVDAILPFCASAKTSIHNYVFLEGVKAALLADANYLEGRYTSPPEAGLRAFGRVYAGWAFSQTFYRDHYYRRLGFACVEELLLEWEDDHTKWDANNLLVKLRTWQNGDISQNELYRGNLPKALQSIRAKAIVMPCRQDLYFRVEDNAREVEHMTNGELRVIDSPWGHCVASGNNDPEFHRQLDNAIETLLG